MGEQEVDRVEVFEVTDEQWWAAIDRRLADLDLTRLDVSEQGLAGRCQSTEVFKIWMLMTASRFQCGDPREHGPHEWYGPALRNDCWGVPPRPPEPVPF